MSELPELPWNEALLELIDKYEPARKIVASPDLTEWKRETLVGLIGISPTIFAFRSVEWQKLVWNWVGEYLGHIYVRLYRDGVVLATPPNMDAAGNRRPPGEGKIYIKISGASATRWLNEREKAKAMNFLVGIRKINARTMRRPDLWLPHLTPHQLTRARARVPLLADALDVQFRSIIASIEDAYPGELPSLPFLPCGDQARLKPPKRAAVRRKAAAPKASRKSEPPKKRGRPRKWESEEARRSAETSKLRVRRQHRRKAEALHTP